MPRLFRFSFFRLLVLLLCCGWSRAATAQRFVAIGDYGYAGPAEQQVSQLIKAWNPEFILTLGDNNYNLGDSTTIDQNIGQYYHEYIYRYRGRYGPSASTNRFFPSLGNHDYYTRNGEPYRDYFTLPGNGRYYDFVRGDVHFFALNSDPAEPDGITATSVQGRWLQAQLAASTARWNVVYLHHAPYSSGSHGGTADLRWPFRAWGASLVLAGHDHHYERLLVDSLPYIVNGLGGRSIYGLSPQRQPGSQAIFNANYGALFLTATTDSLTLQFITRNQVLVDSYVLRLAISAEPQLAPISPNPFAETATVTFSLPRAAAVQLRVFNTVGQEVARLYDGTAAAGWHHIEWSRQALPAGLYYVQLLGTARPLVARAVIY